MDTIIKILTWFKNLKWYWKIIAIIPIIITVIGLFATFVPSTFYSKAIKKHFNTTQEDYKEIFKSEEDSEKKRNQLDTEIEKIEEEVSKIEIDISKEEEKYNNVTEEINSANGDISKLSNIEEKLRRRN